MPKIKEKPSLSKEITSCIRISADKPIAENDKALIWKIQTGKNESGELMFDYEVWMKLLYSTGKKKDQLIEPTDEDFGVKAWVAYTLSGAKHIFDQITEGKRKITPMIEDKETLKAGIKYIDDADKDKKIKIVAGDTGEVLKEKKIRLSPEQKAEMKAAAYEFIKCGITNAKKLSEKGFDIVFCWQTLRQYKKDFPE